MTGRLQSNRLHLELFCALPFWNDFFAISTFMNIESDRFLLYVEPGQCQLDYRNLIISSMRAARASMANGLVSTCIPGSRCPLPIRLFSA